MSEESTPKPKKKKGKLGLILGVLIPLLLVGGGAGLVMTGVVKIPGVAVKKPGGGQYGEGAADPKVGKDTVAQKEEPKPKPKPRPTPPKPAVRVTTPKTDPEEGARKLAKVWNNIPPTQLVRIASGYKDDELARVLSVMDAEVVAQILALFEPARAVRVSRELEELGSVVTEDPAGV
jgi:hypothetical protein